MPMSTEAKTNLYDSLPSRVRAALKSIDRGPGPETDVWLQEVIPALGNRSIMQVLAGFEDGESRIVAYCNTVKGKFF